jgi:hypothetical protein
MKPRSFAVLILVLLLGAGAVAQQGGKKYVIAVAVDSTDARIRQILPKLREEAASVVERSAQNVRASIVTGTAATASEQARYQSADYLLTIEVAARPYISVPVIGGTRNPPSDTSHVPVAGRGQTSNQIPTGVHHPARAEAQGNFVLSYTVVSLAGKNVKLHDTRTIQEVEYPLGPEFDWLSKIATQAVRDGAAAAIKKLKSKKGI